MSTDQDIIDWENEAKMVMNDIKNHVNTIEISNLFTGKNIHLINFSFVYSKFHFNTQMFILLRRWCLYQYQNNRGRILLHLPQQ